MCEAVASLGIHHPRNDDTTVQTPGTGAAGAAFRKHRTASGISLCRMAAKIGKTA
jgi:hypothetical protein